MEIKIKFTMLFFAFKLKKKLLEQLQQRKQRQIFNTGSIVKQNPWGHWAPREHSLSRHLLRARSFREILLHLLLLLLLLSLFFFSKSPGPHHSPQPTPSHPLMSPRTKLQANIQFLDSHYERATKW